jgi:hypothetical protein
MSKLIPEDLMLKMMENHRDMAKTGEADHYPVVKLFCIASRAEWLLSEVDPTDRDLAFGLCDLGMGFPELGYVSLDELGSFGILIERDEWFDPNYPMSVYAKAARMCEEITEDEAILKKAEAILLLERNSNPPQVG